MLRILEVSRAADLASHAGAMDALAAAAPDGAFFDTGVWLRSWLEAFWEPRPAAILLAHDGTDLVGMAPFLPDTDGTAWCRGALTLPHHSHVPRANVVSAGRRDEVLAACLDHVATRHRHAPMTLARVDRDGPLIRDVTAAARARRLHTHAFDDAPMPWIRLDGGWEAYLQSRSSHVRSELRRKRRKFDKAGTTRWTTATRPDEVDEAMRAVMTVERNSWKHAVRGAFTSEPGVAPFYLTLARRAARQGWLRLHVLSLDGQPVAHVLGITYKNRMLALKTSFDESRADLSPGAVVIARALEDACASGLEAFDLLGVESRWKNELATDVRYPGTVCVYGSHAVRCRACRVWHKGIKPFAVRHGGLLVTLKRVMTRARPQGRRSPVPVGPPARAGGPVASR